MTLVNPRLHGQAPYSVAVVHGGPGALGGMGQVARELAASCGVLEPIQTKATVAGQIEELAALLQAHGQPPFTLVGHSWGAWLATLVAAYYPDLVARLVLVCSGPFEAHWAEGITEARLSRLNENDRTRARELMRLLANPGEGNHDDVLGEFGALMSNTDDYDALPGGDGSAGCRQEIFSGVWPQAAAMRASGELMQAVARVNCPVVAIHGQHDPHPWQGVKEPLERTLHQFRFHLLPRCGHTPWRERHAREEFYRLLRAALEQ